MSKQKKIFIALTGGISSGKSLAAHYFEKLGVNIIDADKIAREVVSPGSRILQKIKKYFGNDILTKKGTLNRRQLRKIIFNDKKAKDWLENLLHPLICQTMIKKAKKTTTDYCILIIPLLTELFQKAKKIRKKDQNKNKIPPYQLDNFIDRILVVDVPMSLQVKRIQIRDKISKKQALAVIKTQSTRKERLRYADDVIKNTGNLSSLKKQVTQLHLFYKALAHKSPSNKTMIKKHADNKI